MTTNLPMNKKMIKRWLHLLWLLPAIWLVGCSTDNGANSVEDTGARPIAFTVSTESHPEMTRGYLLDALDTEFGLFCACYDDDEDWGNGHALNFMYNEMVMGDGDSWTTSEGYFVPQSMHLKFFAYYPYYDFEDSTRPLVMDGNETSVFKTPSFSYTMPENASEQLDLMYAISDQITTPAKGKMNVVHLHFRHLLTGLTIAARSNETGVIKRVTLKKLYKKGTFDFVDGGELRAKTSEGLEDVYVDLNMKVKSNGYKTVDEGKSFLLILQPKDANGNIIMNQEAKMVVEFEAGGKLFTFTKSLADLAPALIASKNTLLQLSVESLQSIKISATITDWDNGTDIVNGAVSDQPTLELEPLISDWDGTGNTTNFVTGPQNTNP